MGRKSIPILLKATSPGGETKTFTSFGEAAKELGFSECGVGKAFHEKRIGKAFTKDASKLGGKKGGYKREERLVKR